MEIGIVSTSQIEKGVQMESRLNWKTNTLLAGAVIGVMTGLGAAYLLVRRAEKQDSEVTLSSGEGLRLGILVMGLRRQITQLSE
jgi:uncharacterized membrane protein YadS